MKKFLVPRAACSSSSLLQSRRMPRTPSWLRSTLRAGTFTATVVALNKQFSSPAKTVTFVIK